MMLGLTWALLLTLVTGFLAGLEYDKIRKIAVGNRRLRRAERARKMKKARIRQHLESEQRKYAYMNNVAQNVPEGKR